LPASDPKLEQHPLEEEGLLAGIHKFRALPKAGKALARGAQEPALSTNIFDGKGFRARIISFKEKQV
jgi:hypothetical protein